MESTGFIYVAQGEKFIQEAIASAKSLRDHMGRCHITAYVSEKCDGCEIFDCLINTEGEFNRLTKIQALLRTSYDRTIFLDTDTFICGDLSALFKVLDEF